MKYIEGKYNSTKIFTDVVEESALNQVQELCDTDFLEGTKIRMMPDVHAGKGCTIGTTIKLKDKVVPNHVGVDIGCGILTVRLKEKEIDFKRLDEVIHNKVPNGSNNYLEPVYTFSKSREEFICKNYLDQKKIDCGMGTLGGGNHFIEVSKDGEDNLYLTIHTGSRYLGARVANHYQKIANMNYKKTDVKQLINTMKRKGLHRKIESELNKIREENKKYQGKDLYLEGEELQNYLHDLGLAQLYAKENRMNIANTILNQVGLTEKDSFDTIHNYIDIENNILRKGAVSAKKGERLIIPINMRDGSIIALGKGNEDWNYSAPHGAGRVYSRRVAKQKLSLEEFKDTMKAVWSTSVTYSTLDEAPSAYKKMEDIVGNIKDTVDIIKVIKPVYNFKAKEDSKWRNKNK